ncbi:MAG: C39 family peptidase [Patescibacteria group bacterium]
MHIASSQNVILAFFGFAILFSLVFVSDVIVGELFSAPSDHSKIAALESRLASAKAAKRRSMALESREVSLETLLLGAEAEGIYSSSTKILMIPDVPFVPQSPFGERGNPVLENACEEAVLLMGYSWAVGEPLAREEAREEIFKMAEYESANFGFHEDTSVADTARLMKEYFGYDGASVRDGVEARDIISELLKGNLVIIPVNGQKLGNPRFEPPGPRVHMILVRGYDFARSEFIAHDPGTQFGKDYRYSFNVIIDAFEDYPSGEEVTAGSGTRAMIVIYPFDEAIRQW